MYLVEGVLCVYCGGCFSSVWVGIHVVKGEVLMCMCVTCIVEGVALGCV